jgi:hypothetical protein
MSQAGSSWEIKPTTTGLGSDHRIASAWVVLMKLLDAPTYERPADSYCKFTCIKAIATL